MVIAMVLLAMCAEVLAVTAAALEAAITRIIAWVEASELRYCLVGGWRQLLEQQNEQHEMFTSLSRSIRIVTRKMSSVACNRSGFTRPSSCSVKRQA